MKRLLPLLALAPALALGAAHEVAPAAPRPADRHGVAAAPARPPQPTSGAAASTTVLRSKHDFSRTGPGPIKAMSESQVCIFCHLTHSPMSSLGNRPEGHP